MPSFIMQNAIKLSVIMQNAVKQCHYAKCRLAESHKLSVFMISVIILNVLAPRKNRKIIKILEWRQL